MSDAWFKVILVMMGCAFSCTLFVLFKHPVEINVVEQSAVLKAQYVIIDAMNVDRYVTVWWCGKYGNLVSYDKNIFLNAQDHAILYIADTKNIIGIKYHKAQHVEHMDSSCFWDPYPKCN